MNHESHVLDNPFLAAYSTLNEAQKKAVEEIEGPVLVIAGPGTGKTTILAIRICNILQKTQANPDNILCLTFTETGAHNMRQKLRSFMDHQAHNVGIFTFHAFCHQVIKEHPDVFGMGDLDVVSELERQEILDKIISTFKPDNPLFQKGRDFASTPAVLNNLFNTMKKEGWTYESISKSVEEYLEAIKTDEEFIYKINSGENKKGELKQAKYDAEVKKMERLKAGAAEFSVYQDLLTKMGRFDFEDMQQWVLEAFNKEEWLLQSYQERFQYVLVDEYQDTSGIQNELLYKLLDYWPNPNIFVVGDEDQSIYRFQGANMANIKDFYDHYSDSIQIVLLEGNYRSTQAILDCSAALINQNQERLVNYLPDLVKEKKLKASLTNRIASKVKPQIRVYPSGTHENIAIGFEIKTLMDQGLDLDKVAVIYTKNAHGVELSEWFERLDIPYRLSKQIDLMKTPFVSTILDLLTYIDKESQRAFSGRDLLIKILHFDFLDIPPLYLARIAATHAKNYKFKWRNRLFESPNKGQASLFNNNADIERRLRDFGQKIEGWISSLNTLTLKELFENVIYQSGLVDYVMRSPEKITLMEQLNGFFSFLREENKKQADMTLHTFVELVSKIRNQNIAVPLYPIQFKEHAVTLTTTHSAKGLEFEYVYLLHANKNNWEANKGSNKNFSYPDTLTASISKEHKLEDKRRLFYVALTRAKEKLYICTSENDSNRKLNDISQFVDEIASSGVETKKMEVPAAQLEFYMLSGFRVKSTRPDSALKDKPIIQLPEKEYLKHLLSSYTMSVTHLNNFLRCPLSFYYNSLLRMPAAKNDAMSFGSAMHQTMEWLFVVMKRNPEKAFPSLEEMLSHFEYEMSRLREDFRIDLFQRRHDYGVKVLTQLYHDRIDHWFKDVDLEKTVNTEWNNIRIKGVIDKIEYRPDHILLIDYKTGKWKKEKFYRPGEYRAKDPEDRVKKYGADYWRQAAFYALLMQQYRPVYHAKDISFEFLEPDDQGNFKSEELHIGQNDIDTVKKQINMVYQKIQNLEFEKGCGDEHCDWCNLVKNKYSTFPAQNSGVEEV